MREEMSDEEIASGWFPVVVDLALGRGPTELGYVTTLEEHDAVLTVARERMGELLVLNDAVDDTPEGDEAGNANVLLWAAITAEGRRRVREGQDPRQ